MSAIVVAGKHSPLSMAPLEDTARGHKDKSVSSDFFNVSDQRIHVIAWNILGGIALTAAIAGGIALSMQAISLTTGLLIIPFALLAGYSFWQSNYIDDIDANPQVGLLRREASQMDLNQLEAKYGLNWWEAVFKLKILTQLQFTNQYQKMVSDLSFKQIIECYEEVDRSARVFSQAGTTSHYTVPHPKKWIPKWEEAVSQALFGQIFEICSLETLKKYQLLDLSKLNKIERLVGLDLLAKKEFDKSSEPFQKVYKKTVVCFERQRDGAINRAEQVYNQGKIAENLLDFDLPFLKRRAEIINKRSLCVSEAKGVCAQQHHSLTRDGNMSYDQLSPQNKISYNSADEALRIKESKADIIFRREQSEWNAECEEGRRAAELGDLEALRQRDQVEAEAREFCERAISSAEKKLNQRVKPLQERLEAFERDLKILFQ